MERLKSKMAQQTEEMERLKNENAKMASLQVIHYTYMYPYTHIPTMPTGLVVCRHIVVSRRVR